MRYNVFLDTVIKVRYSYLLHKNTKAANRNEEEFIMKKKLAAIAMATAMAASLAACSSKPAETTAAAEENEETTAEAAEGSEAAEAGDSAFAGKTLVMSTNAEFAPYEYHDGNDIVGIDVDIANAICEDMGAFWKSPT